MKNFTYEWIRIAWMMIRMKYTWAVQGYFWLYFRLFLTQGTACFEYLLGRDTIIIKMRKKTHENRAKQEQSISSFHICKKTTRKILITHYKSHENSSRSKEIVQFSFFSSSQPHNLCSPNSIRHNSSAFSHFMHTNKHNKT